jgi:arabinan endo-1,5-alpha-L-arabinosidase
LLDPGIGPVGSDARQALLRGIHRGMSNLVSLLLCAALTMSSTRIALAQSRGDAEATDESARTLLHRRAVRVHDPSTIMQDGNEFWIFSTGVGISSSRSRDLINWEPGPRVFATVPAWTQAAIPRNQNGNFWAPDIIRLDGRFMLYYSVSSFGDNTSAIGLVTNTTLDPEDPDYSWEDQGLVFQSFEDRDDYNAIDPALIVDQDDRLWMPFGSFWGGIQMIELDRATGKRIFADSPIYGLADYPAIEAPYISFRDPYYYLFVNWDRCCRGLDSTYNIRVGRSESITGPYLDREGRDMREEGGSLLLESQGDFIGPGHVAISRFSGTDWLTVHFYDGSTERGTSMLGMAQIQWDADGWPVVVESR